MSEPFICTKETPWRPGERTPVQHVDAREVGEQRNGYPGGDLQDMECPNCKQHWTMELPQ